MDYLAGLARLSGASPLDSVVSLAQLVLSPGVRMYALAGAGVAAAVFALALALAFAGALGAMARGAADVAGFPANPSMGVRAGYSQRFAPLAATLFFELAALIAMAFAWLVAAIPLAVVSKAAEYGVLGPIVMRLLAAITIFVVYAGLMLWRTLAIAFVAPLYADKNQAPKRTMAFCGARFFALARRFIATDILLVFFVSLHQFLGRGSVTLLAASACSALSLAYLAFSAFLEYAAFQSQGAEGSMPDAAGGAAKHSPVAGISGAAHGMQGWPPYDETSADDFDDGDYDIVGEFDDIGIGEFDGVGVGVGEYDGFGEYDGYGEYDGFGE